MRKWQDITNTGNVILEKPIHWCKTTKESQPDELKKKFFDECSKDIDQKSEKIVQIKDKWWIKISECTLGDLQIYIYIYMMWWCICVPIDIERSHFVVTFSVNLKAKQFICWEFIYTQEKQSKSFVQMKRLKYFT